MRAGTGWAGGLRSGLLSYRRRLLWASSGLLLLSSGCAIFPHRHESAPITILMGPPLMVDTLSTTLMGPPDSLAGTITVPEDAPRPRPPRSSVAQTPQQNTAPLPAPPEKEPERSISVEMSESAREQLRSEYEKEFRGANDAIGFLNVGQLSQEDLDKLQTAKGLIAQSQAAFDQQDFQAAVNLVHKARVLADEIAAPH